MEGGRRRVPLRALDHHALPAPGAVVAGAAIDVVALVTAIDQRGEPAALLHHRIGDLGRVALVIGQPSESHERIDLSLARNRALDRRAHRAAVREEHARRPDRRGAVEPEPEAGLRTEWNRAVRRCVGSRGIRTDARCECLDDRPTVR